MKTISILEEVRSQGETLPLLHSVSRNTSLPSLRALSCDDCVEDEESVLFICQQKITIACIFFVVLTLAACVATPLVFSSVDGYLLGGSVASFISCFGVLSSYFFIPSLQRHPNPLIYNKSLVDFILVGIYLSQFLFHQYLHLFLETDSHCIWIEATTQALLLSGEFWFFAISVDMLLSMTNPFTSFKRNLKNYQRCANVIGIASGILVVWIKSSTNDAKVDSMGFCWFYSTISASNSYTWLLYYIWAVVFMIFSFAVLCFAYSRLRNGLEETFETRKRVFLTGAIANIGYSIWSTGIVGLFTVLLYMHGQSDRNSTLSKLFAFVHGSKGVINGIIWIFINHDAVHHHIENKNNLFSDRDLDAMLKPQLNHALRQQMKYITTRGIVEAVEYVSSRKQRIHSHQVFNLDWHHTTETNTFDIPTYPIQTHPVLHAREMHFYDFQSQLFLTVREMFGIAEEDYIRSFKSATNERLSEGSSGAFVFFTADQKYIVKSMTIEERKFLLSILPAYLKYLRWNKETLLPRFYGCHAMKMYGQTFSFVVMSNIFSTKNTIHRRYDIKGNAPASIPGETYICCNCNTEYRCGVDDSCLVIIGEHQPRNTLKDNDIKKRLNIAPETSAKLVKQLRRDSNFLCGLGITDYSLLIGMHYSHFQISNSAVIDNSESAGNPNAPIFFRSDSICGVGDNGDHAYRAYSVSGPSIYYLGLVDILQTWTLEKKLERLWKVAILRKDGRGVSAMPPKQYASRFQLKISRLFS